MRDLVHSQEGLSSMELVKSACQMVGTFLGYTLLKKKNENFTSQIMDSNPSHSHCRMCVDKCLQNFQWKSRKKSLLYGLQWREPDSNKSLCSEHLLQLKFFI
jgi:hypothetical protein